MQEGGSGAAGRLEVDPQVSPLPAGSHVDGTDDVLQEPHAGAGLDIQLDGDVAHGRDDFVVVGTDHLARLLGRHRDPSPRHLHHRLSVHQLNINEVKMY